MRDHGMTTEWLKTELGEVCEFGSGSGFKIELQGARTGEHPFIKVSDLSIAGNAKWITTANNWVDDTELRTLRAKLFPAGAVVFAKVGAALKLNRRRILSRPTAIDNNMMAAIVDEAIVDPEYLYYFLLTQDLGRHSQDGAVPSVNQTHLAEIPFDVPPLPEQRRIAEILRTWDDAIEKTERLIEAKEKRRDGLANQLLFGTLRLNGKRTTELVASRWFATPADWSVVRIGAVAAQSSDVNAMGTAIPVLSCTKHSGLVDSLEYFDRQVFSSDTSAYKIVRRGQFAYATNHLEEGSIGYLDFYDQGLVSPMYTVFSTAQNTVNDGFLYKLLKTKTFLHIFQANTSASVDRRGGLRWDEFADIRIPLPPIAEQQEISTILDTARRETAVLQAQRDALDKQKRGLMQKLLTGEWRVAVEEPSAKPAKKRAAG